MAAMDVPAVDVVVVVVVAVDVVPDVEVAVAAPRCLVKPLLLVRLLLLRQCRRVCLA